MIPIKGLEKTSFVDYSPYTVSTVFIGGCNFRCPFCHNPDLVEPGSAVNISEETIIGFVRGRKKWIDGVCITGGEPTLFPDLIPFIKKLKSEGFLVKLDTNGTNPEMIQELCDQKLVDYIAMDIKNSVEKYEKTVNSSVNLENIKKSVEILKNGLVDYEFRTTLVPKFHTKKDIEMIGDWLAGSKRFMLQKFRSDKEILDKDLSGEKGFSDDEITEFSEILKVKIDEVGIKN